MARVSAAAGTPGALNEGRGPPGTEDRAARRNRWKLAGTLAALVAASACEQVEQVQDRFRDLTPHEAYGASLAEAGLAETALGRDWARVGREALENPVTVTPPFEEDGYITPEDPSAVAYRIHIPRGRKLVFAVSLESQHGTRLFIDLFRLPNDEDDPPRPVFSSDSLSRVFTHEDPWRAGEYVLRVQPELLRGGTYRVMLGEENAFAFPVEGHGPRSILSFFGASRDGGRRQHHGVDIFARRGTPVLASVDGRASRVRTTRLGGKVVWIRDPLREASVYYAHLDSQHVSAGMLVQRGDTIGFVGNTGNARTTPPHLHYGIYRRGEGPIDPFPLLTPARTRQPGMTADADLLGARVRPRNDGIRLRAGPGTRIEILRELDRRTRTASPGRVGGVVPGPAGGRRCRLRRRAPHRAGRRAAGRAHGNRPGRPRFIGATRDAPPGAPTGETTPWPASTGS